MASAGVGSIVGDILEDRFERANDMQRRDKDPVSWGDLSFRGGQMVDRLRVLAGGQAVIEEEEESETESLR